MLPTPSEIYYFVEVATTLNMSRAAERLGVTQPTLSFSIQRLEAQMGVPLLLRSRTGVRLTRSGERFLQQSRKLLENWEQIRGLTLREETELQGQFTIGCHTSVAQYSLPLFLPGLIKEFPLLTLKLKHDLSRRITEAVVSFEVDFGIVVNPFRHPDLVITQLCEDDVTLYSCSGKGLEARPSSLISDPDLLQSQSLLATVKKSKKFKFDRFIESASLDVVARLVQSGIGVGILPGRVAKSFDGLKPLRDAPTVKDQICLVYRKDIQTSRAAKVIIQSIREGFATK